jgi:archaea-specific DNA-binding protein
MTRFNQVVPSTVEAGVVYIGKKPTMNYVLAVVTHFNDGSREVIVRARGRSISRAVDVAEIVRGRFIPDADVREVRIATEKVASEDGPAASVSSIEIVLTK